VFVGDVGDDAVLECFVGIEAQKRLGNLFHEGFIDRPDRQWEFLNARSRAAVYENGAGAARVLRDSGIAPNDMRTFPNTKTYRQFHHSLMICEALASLDLGARANPPSIYRLAGDTCTRTYEYAPGINAVSDSSAFRRIPST